MKSTGLWSIKKILAIPLFSIVILFPFQNCNRFQVSKTDESSIAGGLVSLTTYPQIYSQLIVPKCLSCHSGAAPSGGMDFSTYSKLMPETKDTTSFFSFFDVTEKIAIVIGMFSFGFFTELTHSQRTSILALMIFFIIGLILLFYTNAAQKKASPNPSEGGALNS